MAAFSHVFTLSRAAQVLGCDEDLLWNLADQLEPEDGILRVHDINDSEILAFTPRGIEALREIINDNVENAG